MIIQKGETTKLTAVDVVETATPLRQLQALDNFDGLLLQAVAKAGKFDVDVCTVSV